MGNFNRDNRGGGRDFNRRGSFSGRRGDRPVEMHRATCDKCHKDCEVPFKPTSGKPIYCKNCFENNRGSDPGFDRSANFEERRMFEAVCDECGNSCKVPFQPRGDKPVYCSNCFGDKKSNGDRSREQFKSQPQYTEQFEQLNNKLDKILTMLTPNAFAPVAQEKTTEEVKDQQTEGQTASTDNAKETKAAKKKPSKKK